MKNFYTKLAAASMLLGVALMGCNTRSSSVGENENDGENENYGGPMERAAFEFERIKDPSLGYVPQERLFNAIEYTDAVKSIMPYGTDGVTSGIWQERGPSYDSVGPSNGNGRGGSGSSRNLGGTPSGRIRGLLVDRADPSGNTVFTGGVNGGLWKCTNFLSLIPNWTALNDNFDNLSVSSICQDPTNSSIMYFATGEATSNADAVYGGGIWKSVDGGTTWTRLMGSLGFQRIFKIVCDMAGNIYVANRNTNLAGGVTGLYRSTNGGTSFTNITPTVSASGNICTDIEISSTGRLHVSMGYTTSSAGGTTAYRYTDVPSTVTSGSGWNSGSGIPTTGNRMELAVLGDTVYAAPTNSANNVVTTYRSWDGGATWDLNNTVNYTTGVSNSQGWYNITLEINPENAGQFIVGGLDAFRSVDTGRTVTKLTSWVNTPPYVHADHHYTQWWRVGGEQRILIAGDGGLFLSRNNGATWEDKNRNLNIKQFYSVAIHPTLDYYLAGSQDNGSHQFSQPGLSYTIEVTGGDGCFVDIDQNEPQFQFTSFVFNQYRRSTNNGSTWSSVNLSPSTGLFINPIDYDDDANIMYCSDAVRDVPNNQLRRWNNPKTGSSSTVFPIVEMRRSSANSNVTALTVSPSTPKRLFIGGSTGRLLRLENADTITTSTGATEQVTDITGASFPVAYLNCVAVGSTDDHLAAIFTNYGVQNIWHSSNGGVSWTALDNNLPDMPVRWAVFDPNDNDKLIIGTEAGVYVTRDINGSSTNWVPSPGFPTCRVDMLKVRKSDGLVAAATHGRGLWTSTVAKILPIKNLNLQAVPAADGIANLTWTTYGETKNTQYTVQYSTDAVSFSNVGTLPYNKKAYAHKFQASIGYYRIMATEPGQGPVFSNTVSVRNLGTLKGIQLKIAPNPVSGSNVQFIISNSDAGSYIWSITDMSGRILQTGKGILAAGGSRSENVLMTALPSGMYRIKLTQGSQTITSAFIKQ
ncbi:MAG: T9SS C-terminal target domain-containing protein [Bacteroidetes bacterium]|nr:MAG: T9SS C-terminal target domain-containing protein [Bacteroidota bacterium]